MNNLLYDEYPLLISPTLATKIGLNEAIILQQINYWTKLNERTGKNFRGGYHWTFNSYSEWRRQFPFLSESTIRRAITKLEKAKLIISGNYNRLSIKNSAGRSFSILQYDIPRENDKVQIRLLILFDNLIGLTIIECGKTSHTHRESSK